MKEAKAVHGGKTKKNNNKKIYSTSYQQVMTSHFLGSGALVCTAVPSENKYLNNKCPISTSHPLAVIVSTQMTY